MTEEDRRKAEEEQFQTGPLSVLTQSVKQNNQVASYWMVLLSQMLLILHAGTDQLPQQSETVGQSESIWQTLQHGPRECQGDVDWDS